MNKGFPIVVIGVGELLWDCFPGQRRPGGAPANVAFHAQQLGARGVVCSRVGEDHSGSELLAYLARHGLDTQGVQSDAEHPTGTVTVDTADPTNPSYLIHENVAWDFLDFDANWAGLFAEASAVCFGTLAQRSSRSRTTIMRCLEAAKNALLVYDVNLRPPWHTASVIESSLHQAHVVKLNGIEVSVLAGQLQQEIDGPFQLADLLMKDYGVQVVCVTRGEAGCLLVSGGRQVDVPGKHVQIVDTVGAGDAFTAALTIGLLRDWPLQATATFANEVGALATCHVGAMPDLQNEYTKLMSQHS